LARCWVLRERASAWVGAGALVGWSGLVVLVDRLPVSGGLCCGSAVLVCVCVACGVWWLVVGLLGVVGVGAGGSAGVLVVA
jgi:hypothetical protein